MLKKLSPKNTVLKATDHSKVRGALCAVLLSLLKCGDNHELTPSIAAYQAT